MTDSERRRFESLDALSAAAYKSFNDRRVYEWKLNLAIWTALVLVIAALLQQKNGEGLQLHGQLWPCLAGVFAIAIVFLHGLWNNWAALANQLDKDISHHNRNAMQEMAAPFPEELWEKIRAHREREGWRQWGHFVEISITAVLSFAMVATIFAKTT